MATSKHSASRWTVLSVIAVLLWSGCARSAGVPGTVPGSAGDGRSENRNGTFDHPLVGGVYVTGDVDDAGLDFIPVVPRVGVPPTVVMVSFPPPSTGDGRQQIAWSYDDPALGRFTVLEVPASIRDEAEGNQNMASQSPGCYWDSVKETGGCGPQTPFRLVDVRPGVTGLLDQPPGVGAVVRFVQPIDLRDGPLADWLRTTLHDVGMSTMIGGIDGTLLTPDQVLELARESMPFGFSGFLPPVKTGMNAAKAGQAIPIKFTLGGDQGLKIFEPDAPRSDQINCSTGRPIANSTQRATNPGSSALSYDAGADHYVFVWKTDSTWKGTCRRFDLGLIDNSRHYAAFSFR